jgi:hypothetical protein
MRDDHCLAPRQWVSRELQEDVEIPGHQFRFRRAGLSSHIRRVQTVDHKYLVLHSTRST